MYASVGLARIAGGLPFDTERGEFSTVEALLAAAVETESEL